MIYDCFPFFNELDVVEIRFKELYDHVDYFVVSESNLTHSGKSKPLYFQENKERFERFNDKIINIVCDNPTVVDRIDMNWTREKCQRNFIYQVLKDRCQDDDIIITSDADEIVDSKKIQEIKNVKNMTFLQLKPSWYFLNLVSDPPWVTAKSIPFRILRDNFKGDLTLVRNSGASDCIMNAGWHFSYMGGRDQVIRKMESFAHQEFNVPKYINERQIDLVIRFGSSIWDEFKEINPRGVIPYWKYVDLQNYELPECVKNGEYNHMLSEVRFNYNYDCGNLYHLFNLAKDLTNEGDVLDIGCGDGRSSVFLANALPDNIIYCMGATEHFQKNMSLLTNGNFVKIDETNLDVLNLKIKLLHINGNIDFLPKLINSIQFTNPCLYCGYNSQQLDVSPKRNLSGDFWWESY